MRDANLISVEEFFNQTKKKNKYGAKGVEYNGTYYQSTLEAKRAQHWDTMKALGLIWSWQGQVKIPLHVNGIFIGNYIADFKIIHKDGEEEYEDTKGVITKMFRWKAKHVRAEYPDLKLFVVMKPGVKNEQIQKRIERYVGVRKLS